MLTKNNVCKFIPSSEIDTDIQVINFVHEANLSYSEEMFRTSHALCIVTAGRGVFTTRGGSFELNPGDVFFMLSAKPLGIQNTDGLEYCYISFVGARVHPLLDRLEIRPDRVYFPGYTELVPFWQDSLRRAGAYNSDLVAHSVLYYTFSFLAVEAYERTLPEKNSNIIIEVKRYVDNNYRDPHISLKSISEKFGYSSKYVSNRFSQTVGVTMTEYITTRRMDYAKAMIREKGYSVSQLSEACGYSDPFYFSRVFKRHFGCSPAICIKNGDTPEVK